MTELTVEYLRTRLSYDPETGELRWKQLRYSSLIGKSAGWLMASGYQRIDLKSRNFYVHRVAWALHYGVWPDGPIDHIDGNRSNNQIDNLRLVTPSQHSMNRSVQKNNKLGAKGVCFHKPTKKYTAQIHVNRTKKHLGLFNTIEEAKAAYDAAAEKFFGEYRRIDETNKGYRTHKAERNDGRSQEAI